MIRNGLLLLLGSLTQQICCRDFKDLTPDGGIPLQKRYLAAEAKLQIMDRRDWQGSLTNILSRTQDNINIRPRHLDTSLPLFQSPTKLQDERISSSSINNSSSSSELNLDLYQQVASLKLDVESMKKLCYQIQDSVMFEFESRTALVSNKVKEEAVVYMEANKIKIRDETRKWEEELNRNIENLKKCQNLALETVTGTVDKMKHDHQKSNLKLEALVHTLTSKLNDKISDIQIKTEKQTLMTNAVSDKFSEDVISRKVNTAITHRLSEVTEDMDRRIESAHKRIIEKVRDRVDYLTTENNTRSSESAKRIVDLNEHITTLEYKLSSVEKSALACDNETKDRVAALETVVSEVLKQQEAQAVEKIVKSYADRELESVKMKLDKFGAEVIRLRKRNAELESIVESLQNRDIGIKDIVKKCESQFEEFNTIVDSMKQGLKETIENIHDKQYSADQAIGTIQGHIAIIRQDMETMMQEVRKTESLYNNQQQIDIVDLRKSLTITNNAAIQKSVSNIHSKLEAEIKRIRNEIAVFKEDNRTSAEEKFEDIKVQLAAIEVKQSEYEAFMMRSFKRSRPGSAFAQSRQTSGGSPDARETSPSRLSFDSSMNFISPRESTDSLPSPDSVLIKSAQLQIRGSREDRSRNRSNWL